MKDDRRFYMDYTGCGNTLDPKHPRILQLVMDSLRYWVEEMRIDGFRFDLAPALAREEHEVDPRGAFFDIIQQDPVLSRVKLIAEPWDLGENGYQLGNFPHIWSEWNGKYRDTVRSYWKGDEGKIGELASCLTGSPQLFERNDRRPDASINFITAHDGFTLNDLVSYNEKHNEANGEDNKDGTDHNISWNCGAEGPTDDPEINKLRRRQRRNFLATLLLSQGVPMICSGDEYGRSQNGNNNAYCQDNELTWFRWNWTDEEKELVEYTRKLIDLRRKHPVFRRPKFLRGKRVRGSEFKEVTWFNQAGTEMKGDEWHGPLANVLGALFLGKTTTIRDEHGMPVIDHTFLLLFNADHRNASFVLPGRDNLLWELIINTEHEEGFLSEPKQLQAQKPLEVLQRSFCLLKLLEPDETLRK